MFIKNRIEIKKLTNLTNTYYGVNDEDMLVRPKVTYEFDDGYEIIAGADIFSGEKGSFGEFDDNDMAYTKFKYSF